MIKSLMAKIHCLRVEKLFHVLYVQIEIIKNYILPSLQFTAYKFVTVPSINILKSKMGLNHLLSFFHPRRVFG